MENFLEAIETGYSKYKNPYHNLVHAADVLQTLYNILNNAGLMVSYSRQIMTDMTFYYYYKMIFY